MDRRNGRRRRVLMEEARSEDTSLDNEKCDSSLAYSESALQQPSLTDLIPVRPLRVVLTVLTSLAALLGLLVLDDWSSSNGVSSFRLGTPGSLASWFGSTLLMWAAGGALLTFLIRRHRKDDYRGAYHIWIWAAIMLVLASVAATTPWHREWNSAATRFSGIDLGPHGWWLTTIGAAALIMAIRVCVDLRQCRTALMLMMLAIAGYTAACLAHTGVLLQDNPQLAEIAGQFGVLGQPLDTRLRRVVERPLCATRRARRSRGEASATRGRSHRSRRKTHAETTGEGRSQAGAGRSQAGAGRSQAGETLQTAT